MKPQVYADARNADLKAARELLGRPASRDSGVALTAWQYAALKDSISPELSSRILITAPDFLNYGRMINTGQAVSLLKLSGSLPRAGMSGMSALPALLRNPMRAAKMDFWSFAEAMMRYDVALLPRSYGGPVLLHSYLADFAFLFDRRRFVESFFRAAGRRAGIHTQQPALALSCLARWGLSPAHFSFLHSPDDKDTPDLIAAVRRTELFARTQFIADVSSLAQEVQQQMTEWPEGFARITS